MPCFMFLWERPVSRAVGRQGDLVEAHAVRRLAVRRRCRSRRKRTQRFGELDGGLVAPGAILGQRLVDDVA